MQELNLGDVEFVSGAGDLVPDYPPLPSNPLPAPGGTIQDLFPGLFQPKTPPIRRIAN